MDCIHNSSFYFTIRYQQNLKHKLPFNFISTYILGAVVKTVVTPSAREGVWCHEVEKVNNVLTESLDTNCIVDQPG